MTIFIKILIFGFLGNFPLLSLSTCDCACVKSCLDVIPPPEPTLPPSISKACPGGIKPLAKPVLWKPEAQGMDDGRKGFPAFLSSVNKFDNKEKLRLFDKNGKEQGTVGFYGSFQQGNRYYSKYRGGSGDSAEQFKRKGAAYIEGEGFTCYGPFDPTKRTGAVQ